ncbi:MAG TPA: V-type ATPase 116kDa subunit family protein [Gaiellaceae bacterium]|nr:V-type ATPase 116kDa subunit family protein [Gaiellaceae bacterium]
MSRAERAVTARMSRVAVVVPLDRLRAALVTLADTGSVELAGPLPGPEGAELEALRRLERQPAVDGRVEPRLAPEPVEPGELESLGRGDLLAGEVELRRRAEAAVRHGRYAAVVGWTPSDELERVGSLLAEAGAAVVELPRPSWAEPPTLLHDARGARPFRPLVDTYGAPRYADVDPTPFAAVAFVVMFGMMFGDVGHGLLLALLGVLLSRVRTGRLASLRRLWPFAVAGGLAAAVFGVLYGEAFGPTGLVPAVWLEPTEDPEALLLAAIGVGAVLLAVSYGIGIVNRWREHGRLAALVAPSGIAGFMVFLGLGLAAAGWYRESIPLGLLAAGLALGGVLLLGAGFHAEAGRGATAVTQATVEVVDAGVRVVANVISFTRLAAFGLMHAALAAVVWDATQALWGGAVASALAVLVFVLGNVLTFSLEALVAGVQALRLEYYELFSRIFAGEGRPFSPWHIPLDSPKEAPWRP